MNICMDIVLNLYDVEIDYEASPPDADVGLGWTFDIKSIKCNLWLEDKWIELGQWLVTYKYDEILDHLTGIHEEGLYD